MALSGYREVQVGFEPCTSEIRGNSLTTKATTKCFRICIFLYYIKYLIGNKCKTCVHKTMVLSLWVCACHKQNRVHKNHGFSPWYCACHKHGETYKSL